MFIKANLTNKETLKIKKDLKPFFMVDTDLPELEFKKQTQKCLKLALKSELKEDVTIFMKENFYFENGFENINQNELSLDYKDFKNLRVKVFESYFQKEFNSDYWNYVKF